MNQTLVGVFILFLTWGSYKSYYVPPPRFNIPPPPKIEPFKLKPAPIIRLPKSNLRIIQDTGPNTVIYCCGGGYQYDPYRRLINFPYR